MSRDPAAGNRARRAEEEQLGLVSIKLDGQGGGGGAGTSSAAGGGFKKGGFKKAGFKSAFAPVGDEPKGLPSAAPVVAGTRPASLPATAGVSVPDDEAGIESDSDYDYELYDPAAPTD